MKTADPEIPNIATDRLSFHPRNSHREIRRIPGKSAKRVCRDNVFHSVRLPLERDGFGISLALAFNDKAAHQVNIRRQPDILGGRSG